MPDTRATRGSRRGERARPTNGPTSLAAAPKGSALLLLRARRRIGPGAGSRVLLLACAASGVLRRLDRILARLGLRGAGRSGRGRGLRGVPVRRARPQVTFVLGQRPPHGRAGGERPTRVLRPAAR